MGRSAVGPAPKATAAAPTTAGVAAPAWHAPTQVQDDGEGPG